jgi:hypothetical protein
VAKKPLVVYLLVPGKGEGKDQKTYFNRAGVAFQNRDGSINIRLDLFQGVTFQIRESQPAEDAANKPS